VQLTDGIGRYEITVEIRDTAEDDLIARARVAEADFPDRSAKGVLVIPVPPLPLPRAGMYDFIVLADGQEIDRQQFAATLREDSADAPDDESTEGPE
jgi:hypothetical protein